MRKEPRRVEPLRDKAQIAAIKANLLTTGRVRDHAWFTLGVNSALRGTDLLFLKTSHVWDQGLLSHIRIVENKTGKPGMHRINSAMAAALDLLFQAEPDLKDHPEWFLFGGRRNKPLDRTWVWEILQRETARVGAQGNFGIRTLRKSWAFHARSAGVPIDRIMEKLNHSSIAQTKRYIGITQDELDQDSELVNL